MNFDQLIDHPRHYIITHRVDPDQLKEFLLTVSTATQALLDASAKRTAAIEANTTAINNLITAKGAQEAEDLAALGTASQAEDDALAAQATALAGTGTGSGSSGTLAVAPNPPPAAVAGTLYAVNFVPTGNTGSVSVAVTSGALPSGADFVGLDLGGTYTPVSGDSIGYTLTFTDSATSQTVVIPVSETVP